MLQNDAMIVRLSISVWTARKFDKSVTAQVASEYAVDSTVGRYNKVLIAKEAIQKITQAVSSARTFHYQNTLPWDDGGARLLPSKNFLEYSKTMRSFREKYEGAVRDFLDNYESYRDDSEVKLGRMFNHADYPGKLEIGCKFGFSTDIEPVPVSSDFRVTLQKGEADSIKKEMDKRLNERLAEATRDLYIRLNDVVGKLAEKLSDKDAVFRDSLVENVVELVGLLPKLNVTNDPGLSGLCEETKKKLLVLEPETLRKDETVRAKAAKDAKAILEKMSGYFN